MDGNRRVKTTRARNKPGTFRTSWNTQGVRGIDGPGRTWNNARLWKKHRIMKFLRPAT